MKSTLKFFRPCDMSGKRATRVAAALCWVAWGSGLSAQEGTSFADRVRSNSSVIQQSSQSVTIISSINLINDIELPALETGQLESLVIKEGQTVKAADVLGKIDDRLANRALEEAQFKQTAALAKAADLASINGARARVEYANLEFSSKEKLYTKGHESAAEYRKAKASKEIADNDLIKALNDQKLAEFDSKVEGVKVQAAQDSIDRHLLRSPIDGYVFEIYKEPQEWVNAGEKVVRIGRLNRLKVNGFLASESYSPQVISGKPVTITARLAGFNEPQVFSGQITFARMDQTVSQTFEVWAEVENRVSPQGQWILYPGVEVQMTIHLDR